MSGPLNPSRKKHRFGKAWMHEHVTDPYVREAQRRGYRSRAAFKLHELAERDRLLRPGMTVVDLGAAPGSWLQVLRERLGPGGRIVAIDLLPMTPVAGVDVRAGRFRVGRGHRRRRTKALGSAAGPCGLGHVPQSFGNRICRPGKERPSRGACVGVRRAPTSQPGGDLVVKVFQGAGLAEFQRSGRHGISPRSTCANRRRRAIAAASIPWSARACGKRDDCRFRETGSW